MTKLSQTGNFAKVEMEHPIFKDGSIGEKVAFVGLCLFAWPTTGNLNKRGIKLKQATLAKAIGVNERNVRKSLAGLRAKGYIVTTQDHPRSATKYTIQRKDSGGQYGIIPNQILTHSGLNPTAKLIYLALSAVVNTESKMALLSWNNMVQKVGVSRRSIPNAIKRLEDTKVVIPYGSTNVGDIYLLNDVNNA